MAPDRLNLHVSIVLADAAVPSTAERCVREFPADLVLLSSRTKPVWIIQVSILVDVRHTVADHYRASHGVPCRDTVFMAFSRPDGELPEGCPDDHRRRRVQPERLLDADVQHVHLHQETIVICDDSAIDDAVFSDDLILLVDGRGQELLVGEQASAGPDAGMGARVLRGEENAGDEASDLRLCRGATIGLVPGIDKALEHVLVIDLLLISLLLLAGSHDVGEDGVESLARHVAAAVGRDEWGVGEEDAHQVHATLDIAEQVADLVELRPHHLLAEEASA